MRASGAVSVLNHTLPYIPSIVFIFIILIILVIIFYKSKKSHYLIGLKMNLPISIAVTCMGVFFIIYGLGVCFDTNQYIRNTIEAYGTVKSENQEVVSTYNSSDTNYYYLINLTHKDIDYEIRMSAPGYVKTSLDVGDKIKIHYEPETLNTHKIIAVATDLEKGQGTKYMIFGILICITGVLFIIYTKSKEKLLETGFRVMANVKSLSESTSRFTLTEKRDYVLVCVGKNPITGLNEEFQTHGSKEDFEHLNIDDTVGIYVDSKKGKRHIFDI